MFKSINAPRPRHRLLLAFLGALALDRAVAQSNRPDIHPGKTARELLQAYQGARPGTEDSQALLIGVLNKTLPASDANLNLVRQSLAQARSMDDKILLIKVLTSMYAPRERSQQNLAIETDIKQLIDSNDQRLAAEAVIEYSRLAYPPDRYPVLQRAHDGKIIDDDAYYGELAHGLRFSPADQQLRMLDEMGRSNNAFAHEVLASTFVDPEGLGQLDPAARRELFKVLAAREPGFPLALDNFGGIDIARYAMWINAVATVEAELTGKAYADLVLARLSGPRVDPRKILALFGHPEGQRVIRDSRDRERLRELLARGQAYSDSLPRNTMLKDAAGSFATKMASLSAGTGNPD